MPELRDHLRKDLQRSAITLDLDDIQATVLRHRPEPYYGTHIMGHFQDARGGWEWVRRLAPHVDSLGFKDLIGQPAIEGSGVEPLPGQGRPIKAGEFILGYPGEAGVPLPMPQPDVLGRNGTFVGLRKYQSRVGAFNRFLHANAHTDEERELLAAEMFGRWRSGAPLTLAPTMDDLALCDDPLRNNDFTYANDAQGEQVPLGSHMRRMNPRDTRIAAAHGCEPAPHHPAKHRLRSGLRPGRNIRAGRRGPARALFHLPQRQGDGHARVPTARVDQRRRLHGPRRGA
ncbi:MAG TPA: hypothetical protein VIQ74_04935 [Gemmatimonadaceae bacterium]|jgi:Predicted iron-dependent peroxidase